MIKKKKERGFSWSNALSSMLSLLTPFFLPYLPPFSHPQLVPPNPLILHIFVSLALFYKDFSNNSILDLLDLVTRFTPMYNVRLLMVGWLVGPSVCHNFIKSGGLVVTLYAFTLFNISFYWSERHGQPKLKKNLTETR